MRRISVAVLCLLGVAMVMAQGGMPGEGPPPFSVSYLLENFLDDQAGNFVKAFIAGQCRDIFQESGEGPPPPADEPDKRKLATLLEKYLHRQKRALEGEDLALQFCRHFIFGPREEM